MPKHEFEELASNAAAGLRNDQELFLDVKLELQSHLDDKAEQFARDGHSAEESRELAEKSFGSPMDVAAEILAANRRRMRLRSLMRLTLGALIVPVAIVLALYAGYGRMVRLQELSWIVESGFGVGKSVPKLPALPFQNTERKNDSVQSLNRMLASGPENVRNIHKYWAAHRSEPNSHKYYAYYALHLDPNLDKNYVEAMRQGERIEPDNALYNINLAYYYLDRGIKAKLEKSEEEEQTDTLLDESAFEAGTAELRKAAAKPYMRTYQAQIMRMKLNSMPTPVLTEDYIGHIATASAEMFPHLARNRSLARKIPGCARILHDEGRNAEAEAVMDTWKPYARFLVGDNQTLIHSLVAHSAGKILTKEAFQVYGQLADSKKAEESQRALNRLEDLTEQWRAAAEGNRSVGDNQFRSHGSTIARIIFPVFGGNMPTERELAAGRMAEHVVVEEGAVNVILALLVLALIGALVQGAIWLYKLRRAGAVPILLLPPWQVIMRAMLLGVALPVVAYWVYSRMPVIGGREFSIASTMWPRFAAEMLIVALLLLWLPAHVLRQHVRKRCDELGIAVPDARNEAKASRVVRAGVFLGLVIGAAALAFPAAAPPLVSTAGVVLGPVLLIGAIIHTGRTRKDYGLYYGTLARSLTPVYALSILLLSITVQPLLMHSEAGYLRRDTIVFGQFVDSRDPIVGFSAIERRVAQDYSNKLIKALDDE